MTRLRARLAQADSRVRAAWRSRAAAAPGRSGFGVQSLRLPVQPIALAPDRLLLPLDLVRDSRSLAGTPLAESPHLDFARRVLAEPNLDHAGTAFHRVSSHLAERSATASIWGPDQDCAEFTYLIQAVREGWYENVEQRPVVLAELRDGRHMVMSGVRVLAAAIALGRTTWDVQIAPENEVRAAVRQPLEHLTPRAVFRRNLALAGMLGTPAHELEPAALALSREIAGAPLVAHGDVYQPLPFPEFADLRTQADDLASYQRLGLILDACPQPHGMRYLDLGCNVGFYCFSLARRGAVVTGVDIDDRFIGIARRAAANKGVAAEFIRAPLEPTLFTADGILGGARPSWDLVTCFSTLQWVIEEHDEEFAVELLTEIGRRSTALLIDIPVNCGSPRLSAAPGWELGRTAELIHAAGYRSWRHIGTVAPYRVDRRHVFYCRSRG